MRYLWGEKFPGCLGKDNLFKMILHTFFRGGWEHPCLFEAPKQQEGFSGGWRARAAAGSEGGCHVLGQQPRPGMVKPWPPRRLPSKQNELLRDAGGKGLC